MKEIVHAFGLFSNSCVFFFVEKCLNVTNVEKVCRLLLVM